MDILSVLKAYEVLRANGLVLPTLELENKVGFFNTKDGNPNKQRCQGESSRFDLHGNVASQYRFLSSLNMEAKNHKKDDNNPVLLDFVHQSQEWDDEVRIMKQKIQSDSASKEEINQEGDKKDSASEQEKDFMNHTITELLAMKEDVEEHYGKGAFNKFVGQEIYKLLADDGCKGESLAVPPVEKTKSFKQALTGGRDAMQRAGNEAIPRLMKQPNPPRLEGGNLVVDLDEEEYRKGVENLKYSVVGKLFLKRGTEIPNTIDIKNKLVAAWCLEDFKLVPMGGGHHHLIFNSLEDQCKVLASGPINLSPGTFRVARWQPGFDLACMKSTTQAWIRIYGMPLEFRGEQNLLNIAAAVGLPLKIDPATISFYQGLYARVLVDIDLSKRLPERILASLKSDNYNTHISFFVRISYENLPSFCGICKAIGHDDSECLKQAAVMYNGVRRDEGAQARREGERRQTMVSREDRRNTTAKDNSLQPVGVKSVEGIGATTHALDEYDTNAVHAQDAHDGHNVAQRQNVTPAINSVIEQISIVPSTKVNQGADISGNEELQEKVVDSIVRQYDTADACKENVQQKKAALAVETHDRDETRKSQTDTEAKNRIGTNTTVQKQLAEEQNLHGVILESDDCYSPKTGRAREDVLAFSSVQHRHASKVRGTFPIQGSSGAGLANRFEQLGSFEIDRSGMLWTNVGSDQITRHFPYDTDSFIRENIREENVRKEAEWEKTKARLEERMQADMARRKGKLNIPPPPPPPPSPPTAKRGIDSMEEDEAHEVAEATPSSVPNTSVSGVPETQVATSPILDPDKIYWDEENEIYFHVSGICYDPEVKVYYSLIDQKGGDLRPIYYIQTGGDFFVAKKGNLGQSNKVLMDDKSWNKQAIYSIKSPRYKSGLLKMFKDKIKEGATN